MKTVKVTPDNIISVINVDFDDFRDLQKAVGGHFETVSTKTLYETFKMPMIMLVDEDGINFKTSHVIVYRKRPL